MQQNQQNFKPAREIKFRAWAQIFRKDYRMIDWEEICKKWHLYQFTHPEQYGCLLMQFTGQKDKEANEIYEGDIINIHAGNPYDVIEGNHIVRWNLTGWYIERCDGVDYTDVDWSDLALYNYTKASEIIGNIYENPELVTGALAV